MRTMSITITFMLLMSFQLMASNPPDKMIIDQYVNQALRLDREIIQGEKSVWTCKKTRFFSDVSYGETQDDAAQHLQLLCIKDQCKRWRERALDGLKTYKDYSDSELRSLFKSIGFPENIIDQEVVNIRKEIADPTSVRSCESGSDSIRMSVFDDCSEIPKCNKI